MRLEAENIMPDDNSADAKQRGIRYGSESGDWPDLAASATPRPLLVQFLLDDALFIVVGLRRRARVT
jgi:hypothetical protein